MRIILIRHSEAIPVIMAKDGRDASRELTENGIDNSKLLKKVLNKLKLDSSIVISSSVKRAVQTAGIISENTIIEERLASGASVSSYFTVLHDYPDQNLILVGHQPDLGRFVSYCLTCGSMEMNISFSTSAFAVLEIASLPITSPAKLLCFISPEQFQSILQ